MSDCSAIGIIAIVVLIIILIYIIYEQNKRPVKKVIDTAERRLGNAWDDLTEGYVHYYPWRMRRYYRGWPHYGRRWANVRPIYRPVY